MPHGKNINMMTEKDRMRLDGFALRALSTLQTVYNSFLMAEYCILNDIQGDFVECGVFAGTQIAAMAYALEKHNQKRTIHLFDSFEGIPQAGPEDDRTITDCIGKGTGKGELISTGVSVCSVEQVQAHMKQWGFADYSMVYHKGWFQNTVPASVSNISSIAILRLDGDLYESTKVCLEHLHPLVVKNGIVIIDDYALHGCKKAVHEYWADEKMFRYF